MKKHLGKIAILSVLVMAFSISASAQIYVKVRPVVPVVVHSERPGPAHVWVNEEWEWRDGRYVSTGGRWVAPPRAGMVWVPGHWKKYRHDGWQWMPGRWRRR